MVLGKKLIISKKLRAGGRQPSMKNKKQLGQHWLKDREILLEIAAFASGASDVILEIGPGLGTLTSALFRYFDQVIAVEFDQELAAKLPASFPGKDLNVINSDILSFDESVLPENYSLAGNVPYYITSPIIQKFLTSKHRPKRMVLLIQKEVAERVAADVGRHSILSLSAQIYAKVSLGPVVLRSKFTPPPKVDSQVVIFEPYETPLAGESTMALIKLGFSSPRKKLSTNLSVTLRLPREEIIEIFTQLKIPEGARPADLSLDDWKKLEISIHKR